VGSSWPPKTVSPMRCICADLGCSGAEELCRFRASAEQRSFRLLRRGERLPANGAPCLRLSMIRRGLVAACAMTPDGRRQILCLNVPGDPLCPMSAEGSICWCEALAETELCELDLSTDVERLHRDPAFNAALFRLTHDRLERSAAHLVTLGRFDGMERICGFLADMTRRIGRRQGTGWLVCLPMSREDIADYLGLNTETVSRLFTRIRKAGLAHLPSRTEYEIPSLERLEARIPVPLSRGFGGGVGVNSELTP